MPHLEPIDTSQLVTRLSEDFLTRRRAGEDVTVQEYVNLNPNLAAEIREVFPLVASFENIAATCSNDDVNVGKTLADYRILRQIGVGGMGVVFEAEQLSLRRRVALKIIGSEKLRSKQHRQRFEREARAAASLHHTNIVPVHDVGSHDQTMFYAMQLIDGQPLNDVIADLQGGRSDRDTLERGASSSVPDEAPLARPPSTEKSNEQTPIDRKHRGDAYWRRVARIGAQVASALQHAHDHDVLHRDIKPSNLILDQHDDIWVTDFGLAKTTDSDLTQDGDVVGTLRYLAPESFSGAHDARSDLYSLGLTLYELLALQPAFRDRQRSELVGDIMEANVVPLATHDASIPADLRMIVEKAIHRDPADRYLTAGDMADDLRRYLRDEPILARRLSRIERVTRWARRNPMTAMLTTTTAFLLAALAVGSFAFAAYSREQQQLQHELALQRLQLNHQLDGRLEHVESLLATVQRGEFDDSKDWREAEKAREAVEVLLAGDEVEDVLRTRAVSILQRVDWERKDRAMAARLRELWNGVMAKDLYLHRDFGQYENAFVEYGISPKNKTPQQAAVALEQLSERSRRLVIDGLNRWFLLAGRGVDKEAPPWVFETLLLVDQDAWRVRLRQSVRQKDMGAVIKQVRQLSRSADVDQPLSVVLGVSQYIGGWRWESIRLLERAWQEHPDDFHIAYLLAEGMTGQADIPWSETARMCTAAIALNPDSADAHAALAYALGRDLQTREALIAIDKAISLAPDWGKHYADKGIILLIASREAEAAAAFQYAWDLGNSPGQHRAELPLLLYKLRRYEQAICVCREWIKRFPSDPQAHLELGRALKAIGRAAEAEDAFAQALTICPAPPSWPDSRQPYGLHGRILAAMGRDEGAVSSWRTARRSTHYPGPTVAHARWLGDRGRTDEMQSVLRDAIEEHEDWVTLQRAGKTLQEAGEFEGARKMFQRAHEMSAHVQQDIKLVAANYVNATRLVEGAEELDRIHKGGPIPEAATHCLWLARQVAIPRREFTIALRLYDRAFERNPALLEDFNEDHSYTAAWCAARTLTSQASLSDQEVAYWRQESLRWLTVRHEAIEHAHRAPSSNRTARRHAYRMRQPLFDSAFAIFRVGRSELPIAAPEQASWDAYWHILTTVDKASSLAHPDALPDRE